MNLQGIDVSTYNGTIDWSKVNQSGIRFAIARASYGKSGRDPKFLANVQGAQSHGLDVGAYHYSYATSVAQAQAEAQNLLSAVKGLKLTYPLVFDLEYNSYTARAAGHWSDMAAAFLRTLENAGYFAMLYSDKYSLETRFDAAKIVPFAVWVAQWAHTNTYSRTYGIWQDSNTGSVPGITGNVDRDISYVDYATIIKHAGLNHLG